MSAAVIEESLLDLSACREFLYIFHCENSDPHSDEGHHLIEVLFIVSAYPHESVSAIVRYQFVGAVQT